MKNSLHKILPLSIALTLGACGSLAASGGGVDTRTEVSMVRIAHAIVPEKDGDTGLSVQTIAKLTAFLDGNSVGYGDTLLVDQGPALSADRVDALVVFLKKRGHTIGETDGIFGGLPVDGGMTLYVERYVAELPQCPNWSQDSSYNPNNADMPNLGCATTSALDAAVANPRDLIDGQDGGSSSKAATKAAQRHQATTGSGRVGAGGQTGGGLGGATGGGQ